MNDYIRNGNGRLAAKEAGYGGSDHTLEKIASENLRKPEVTAALATAFQPEGNLAERVVSEMKLLAFAATDEAMSQANKIRSLELLAKVLQMFKDTSEVKLNVNLHRAAQDIASMSEEELLAELERIERDLSLLFCQKNGISSCKHAQSVKNPSSHVTKKQR